MSIENANYIHELNVSNPKPVDPISEGDNHIRLIKKLLTESFPSDLNGMVVPNITDNADKYLRVNEDGDAIEWHELQVQGAGVIPFRSRLSWKDGSTIIVSDGEYTHKNQPGTLSWTENKELTINNPSGPFAYIYLENSGTVTLSWSDNGPTWSDTARGWYLDDKRCIGAVRITDGVLEEFFHDGKDYIQYSENMSYLGTFYVNNGWEDYTVPVPSFCFHAHMFFYLQSDGDAALSASWYGRPKGSESEGLWLGKSEGGGSYESDDASAWQSEFYMDENQMIQVKGESKQNEHLLRIATNGFYLPRGI
jgi:hypothetical protein